MQRSVDTQGLLRYVIHYLLAIVVAAPTIMDAKNLPSFLR